MTKYYRVILRIPEALEFETLTPEQQAAIASVFGQFVMPIPGTVPAEGYKLCDAVTGDNFQPERMALYNFKWPIIGVWDEQGNQIKPFNGDMFMKHLPEPAEGEKVLHELHRWAGWPELF